MHIIPRKAPKMQTTNLRLQIRKTFNINCIMLKNQKLAGKNTVDSDETAHYETSHLDLQRLQIQLSLC